ncbi:protein STRICTOSIDINE SYNTHASE-LIKE 10-like [Andrographis paniculata]|uniref:protein STRICTOSIDINE SYNTHASE-LIKE 10-like n=1 Tax=Andrographis paniculata TaxID=175694 RepID=UPI0021E765D7|nr:protein STRICTOSIDINE SYNTHASE-LIKE 10-like [Andrographis paniculata]XP_051150749.1 protein STRICTOSIDINE SYNTHASE-LIKE 10-like [Andrographis paniculata]XP_051150756.1 protein STRICTOSIDINE SYNTHASE-LIKE 10-like [Andrographis paniculata]XP_051150758.1 protein STRICTOSIDINE SYNTHASE-LIKE 10-like [Andrographis paniculata]XP_051150761.1 protein STRICTOSIDINE SYNTHASE-LIKE 10-like [Andrographis paniculata]
MNSKLVLTAVALPLLAVVVALATTGVFTPPQVRGSLDILPQAERIHLTEAVGPESLVFDPSGGGPYTGVADGRILKLSGGDWVEFAVTSRRREECTQPFNPAMEHVCGRPLGLRFHPKTGDLYIADAYLGLQVVGPAGGLATQLVTEVEGQPLRFTNDMDIDDDKDVIYFTDSSTQFHRREFIPSILTSEKTGKLMKYGISSKQVTVLLRGLAFANGVALSKDRSFVLVVETTTRRVLRYWLEGSNAGQHEVFAELPGFPDNVRRNPKGEFWVALHSKTGLFSKYATSWSWLGHSMLKLPLSFPQLHYLLVGGKPHATAVKLSEKGEILLVLEDVDGKTLRFISEIEERDDGTLWIASVLMPYIGIYKL